MPFSAYSITLEAGDIPDAMIPDEIARDIETAAAVAAEEVLRTAEDVTLTALIAAEAAVRASADSIESYTRGAVDTTLQNHITDEASARAAADIALVPARTAPGKAVKLPVTAGGPLVEAGSLQVVGDAGFVLTGSITPAASAVVAGTGTLFLTELKPGDRVTIGVTTKTVISIQSDLQYTADAAYLASGLDSSVAVLPCIESHVDNAGVLRYVLRSDGVAEERNGATLLSSYDTGGGNGQRRVGSDTSYYGQIEYSYTPKILYLRSQSAGIGYVSLYGGASGTFWLDTVAASLTAGATQTQAGATTLSAILNFIGTCATIGNGVKLQTAVAGLSQFVYNGTALPAQVWPNTSDNFGAGVDLADPALLMPGEGRWYYAQDATNWVSSRLPDSVANALTATGTTQSDAYALTADYSRFTTVAAGTGCKATAARNYVVIINRGANALIFYPESGSAIDGGSADAGVSIPADGSAKFKRFSATIWESV